MNLEHRLGDAAENPLAQPGMTIGAHDHQICRNVAGVPAKHVGNRMVRARQPVDHNLHTVSGKIGRGIRTWLLAMMQLIFYWIDDDKAHIIGAFQYVERLANGAR